MKDRAIAYNRFARRRKSPSVTRWMSRIDRSLRNLRVSHSQLRITTGTLRESVDSMNKQVAQQRADIHDLEKSNRSS